MIIQKNLKVKQWVKPTAIFINYIENVQRLPKESEKLSERRTKDIKKLKSKLVIEAIR
jgi:hypothetical protein